MSYKETKILHCSDLHIGFEYSLLGDIGLQQKAELLFSFEKIINICRNENVDFLCIAGDLFDHVHVKSHLVHEVIELIKSIPETIVVITPGNHDPFCVDSYYYMNSWPENVVIFQDELSYVLFKEKGVCIWGAGFSQTYHESSFLSTNTTPSNFTNQNSAAIDEFNSNNNIFNSKSEYINICVMHGDFVQKGQTSLYNPIYKDSINQFSFDYLALGHVHKRTPVNKENKTFWAYPGSPQGHGFDELGELGVYIGFVSKGRLSLQFRRICTRCYQEIDINLDFDNNALSSSSAISEFIISNLMAKFPFDTKDNLYKIILRGDIPQTVKIDIEAILLRLKEFCYYVKIEDQTSIMIDYDSLSKDQTLKGIFVRKMIEKIHEARSKKDETRVNLLKDALNIGLKAFDSEVILRDYK